MNRNFDPIDIVFISLITAYLAIMALIVLCFIVGKLRKLTTKKKTITTQPVVSVEAPKEIPREEEIPVVPMEPTLALATASGNKTMKTKEVKPKQTTKKATAKKEVIKKTEAPKTTAKTTTQKKKSTVTKVNKDNKVVIPVNNTVKKKKNNNLELINKEKVKTNSKANTANNAKKKNNSTRKTNGYVSATKKKKTTAKKKTTNKKKNTNKKKKK